MAESIADTSRERKIPVRSAYLFPVYSLGPVLEMVSRVELDGGGRLSEGTLAINTGMSAKSSSFKLRSLSARQFGLMTKTGENLVTTNLAKSILKPTDEREKSSGLKEAFLNIPLFKAVAARFKGQPLPTGSAFRNVLEREFHLEAARVVAAERVLMDSAKEANILVTSGGNTYLSTEATLTVSDSPARGGQAPPQGNVSFQGQNSRGAAPPPQPPAGLQERGIFVSELDLAAFSEDEFDEVWRALGKVFRRRGQRQMADSASASQLPPTPNRTSGSSADAWSEDDDEENADVIDG